MQLRLLAFLLTVSATHYFLHSITLALLAGAFVGIFCVGSWQISSHSAGVRAAMPGYKAFPVLGSLLGMPSLLFNNKSHEGWLAMRQALGPSCYFTLPYTEDLFILVSQPEDVRTVMMVENSKSSKGPGYKHGLGDWMGMSVLIADYAPWKVRRQLLNPFFHFDSVKSLNSTIQAKIESYIRMVQGRIAANGGSPTNIDVGGDLRALALDVIGLAGFGHSFNSLENGSADIYIPALETCLAYDEKAGYGVPTILYPDLYQRYKKAKALLRGMAMDIIVKRRAAGVADGEKDILASMIRSNSLTNEEMVDECLTFLFAGSDTTANMLATLLNFLSKKENHPTQERIAAELKEKLPANPTSDDYKQLPYLNSVIKEALRLWPSAPAVCRHIDEPFVLPSSGAVPPIGSYVVVSPWVTHREKNIWGADADEFDPERFMPDRPPPPQNAYLPFMLGARNCIGQSLATMEAQAVLSTLLSQFKFTHAADKPEPELLTHTTLFSPTGFWVKVSPRP
eukprot:gnl/Hemi2/10419_TR3595_c0_g1_i1.p1 gnl/Hemi2/10419_TR3595_c0_g1~~gnl/Hemi2/10419_TR3595_c0_g1_i1.p1  ORF type:complete len:510 (-),score=166.89 gnl/Hemi2/10419_TR3595_c0_g1_i1:160-1689(-)